MADYLNESVRQQLEAALIEVKVEASRNPIDLKTYGPGEIAAWLLPGNNPDKDIKDDPTSSVVMVIPSGKTKRGEGLYDIFFIGRNGRLAVQHFRHQLKPGDNILIGRHAAGYLPTPNREGRTAYCPVLSGQGCSKEQLSLKVEPRVGGKRGETVLSARAYKNPCRTIPEDRIGRLLGLTRNCTRQFSVF